MCKNTGVFYVWDELFLIITEKKEIFFLLYLWIYFRRITLVTSRFENETIFLVILYKIL